VLTSAEISAEGAERSTEISAEDWGVLTSAEISAEGAEGSTEISAEMSAEKKRGQ
jgi:hypothetical protein